MLPNLCYNGHVLFDGSVQRPFPRFSNVKQCLNPDSLTMFLIISNKFREHVPEWC